MFNQIKTSILMLITMTLLTGVFYPLAMTGVAQVLFQHRANGSLIERDGKVVGSELIGQPFSDAGYFWGRPSATGPFPYNAAASTGSNLAVTNPSQIDAIEQRVRGLRESDPGNTNPIPIDLVTASGSGLDPHISLAAARWQIARVARTRGLDETEVARLVSEASDGRQFGILGEPVVNVVELNLSLEKLSKGK